MKGIYRCLVFIFVFITSAAQACPTSNITVSDATCFGTCDASMTINTTGGVPPYQVFHPGTGIPMIYTSTIVFNGLCAGTYNIYVIDNVGCTEMQTITIFEPTQLSLLTNVTSESFPGACDGIIDVAGNGGTPGYAYTISPPMPAPYENLCSGTYTVCVADANGCVTCEDVIVDALCDLNSTLLNQSDVLCYGDCNGTVLIQTTGGQPPYMADPGNGSLITYSSVGTVTDLCPGTYDIITTDANGCSDTVTVTILEPPLLVANATDLDASGPGICDGILDGTATGGVPAYTYNWINCTTLLSAGTSEDVINICAGDYQLIVTDANGCDDTTLCINISDSIDDTGFMQNTIAFKIYPNPTSDQLIIETEAPDFRFEILNALGEVVYISNVILSNSTSISLNAAGLSEGVYVVRLFVGEVISVSPLVIQGE